MYEHAITKKTKPNCPPPKNYVKQRPEPKEDDAKPKQDTCLTTNTNQTDWDSNINILQRPKQTETRPSTITPSRPSTKTLQQRQEEYDFARKQIFDTLPTIAPIENRIYKHPNHALRTP